MEVQQTDLFGIVYVCSNFQAIHVYNKTIHVKYKRNNIIKAYQPDIDATCVSHGRRSIVSWWLDQQLAAHIHHSIWLPR